MFRPIQSQCINVLFDLLCVVNLCASLSLSKLVHCFVVYTIVMLQLRIKSNYFVR